MRLNILSKLFRWQPSREIVIPTIAGFIVLGLSALMITTYGVPWVSFLIRDIGMIFLMGIFLTLVYMKRSGAVMSVYEENLGFFDVPDPPSPVFVLTQFLSSTS